MKNLKSVNIHADHLNVGERLEIKLPVKLRAYMFEKQVTDVIKHEDGEEVISL